MILLRLAVLLIGFQYGIELRAQDASVAFEIEKSIDLTALSTISVDGTVKFEIGLDSPEAENRIRSSVKSRCPSCLEVDPVLPIPTPPRPPTSPCVLSFSVPGEEIGTAFEALETSNTELSLTMSDGTAKEFLSQCTAAECLKFKRRRIVTPIPTPKPPRRPCPGPNYNHTENTDDGSR